MIADGMSMPDKGICVVIDPSTYLRESSARNYSMFRTVSAGGHSISVSLG